MHSDIESMSGVDSEGIKAALEEALEVKARAYAPYSGFRMGALVVTSTGKRIPGVLVENVSLGLAMCAERVALFGTVADGAGRPELLALASRPTDGELTWPCGACLQVAMELGGPELIVAVTDGKRSQQARLRDLAGRLPVKKNSGPV